MIIKIPANNIAERKYILDIIFNEFLGLEYILEIGSHDYEIVFTNTKKLIIKDCFFNRYPTDLEYLKKENIPKSIKELDIFAACFFMLTRWEEYVNTERDEHNRFPAYASLAYKEAFLDKAIVNELILVLKQQLLALDDSLIFQERKNELILTHDVDHLYFYKNSKQLIKMILGDILKRKNFTLAFHRIKEYILVKTLKRKDPFDTFELFMDISEKVGLKSRFYFMSGGLTKYDNNYKIDEKKSLELIEYIKDRGHYIGIHPSYNAYNNFEQFKKEKELLERVTQEKIIEGREHYLRFEVPTTWQIWEDNGMKIDSTCGYADYPGFRCGTGDEFSVFNILTRKKLQLKERPLVVMDCSLFDYNDFTPDEAYQLIKKMKEKTSMFTILWHNSYLKYNDFYERVTKL